jgi:prepilin-type N-terminal cleavage/methylation domain-containing protein
MKNNQKGFSVVEILVVLVIVGLLGTVGWLIHDRQSSKIANEQTSVSQTKTQTSQNQTETKQDAVKDGTISGKLGYPSGNAAQNVCAVSVINDKDATCISTSDGQDNYSIQVKPGDYYVYSSLRETLGDFTPSYKAYYDEFSKCGNSVDCPDAGHKQYVKVTVTSGKSVNNVDPTDWYGK